MPVLDFQYANVLKVNRDRKALVTPFRSLTTDAVGSDQMAKEFIPHDGPIVTRPEAKAAGLKRYFTGKPCKHGHVDERMVSSKQCCECGNASGRAAYARDPQKSMDDTNRWRRAHRDRWNSYVRRHAKKPEQAERRAEYQSSDYAKRLAREASSKPERRAQKAAYRKANPERNKIWLARKNAIRRSAKAATENPLTLDQWRSIINAHGSRCAYCKKKSKKLTMDHVIALARGGKHEASNIVPACHNCNTSKHAKDPIEFALQRGRLCW